MRRLMFLLVAVSFLGTIVGCNTCGSGGCGLGGGCGSGCGAGAGAGGKCVTSHGVCDCTVDDYCSSRSPWIRYGQPILGPVAAPVAEPIPVAPAKVLPKAEIKL